LELLEVKLKDMITIVLLDIGWWFFLSTIYSVFIKQAVKIYFSYRNIGINFLLFIRADIPKGENIL